MHRKSCQLFCMIILALLILPQPGYTQEIIDVITTFAGDGTASFGGDGGPAAAASLNNPHRVIIDASDNAYIADYYNHRLRKVDSGGTITTVAGTGIAGYRCISGQVLAAEVIEFQPDGVATIASERVVSENRADDSRIALHIETIVAVADDLAAGYDR